VLFGIPRARLERMLLPIGEHSKEQIRRIAAELAFSVAEKRESQEICFVPPGRHGEFIRLQRPDTDRGGNIVTSAGKVVGRHTGIENFTIGQRKGLGVAMGEPYFVVRIDALTRDVIIGPRSELARTELTATDTNWLADVPDGPFRCTAKIRYNSPPVPAIATRLSDQRLHVKFEQPVFGVAPGQAVVCYDSQRVLGGGWIE